VSAPRADLGRELCVGIDVGGTFTDAVLTDGLGIWRAKAATTPGDVGRGVLAAATLAAARAGRELQEVLPSVRRFGLGTTAVTNVLASRAGLRVGLMTTAGFEELVPFARGRRVNDGDGWLSRPPEIVAPDCIVGVDERVDRDGVVVRPLDTAEVVARAEDLVERRDVEAIAVSFLWSFRNPDHEEQAARAITERYPSLHVVSAAALHPVIREFERTTFALLNAYTAGSFAGVESLADELSRLGLRVPLLLVHSAGGSITVDEARREPVGLAASGPAAGVSAAATVAASCGVHDVVTCDMGGTSFDVSVITAGQPTRRMRGELMGVWTSLSLVDVESIGAGGGSIAWVDARGMLRVGPRSAGAVPGPACYGRGGHDATVTDALVVLGYLDPARFLGGDMALDADEARAACARLGAALGLDAHEAAWGVRELALAGMVKAVRSRLAGRGLDPRAQALLSFGGCGGLFTASIAGAIGAPRVLVPELASVLSAFGAATADVRRERLRAVVAPMPVDPAVVEAAASELRLAADKDLAADGVPAEGRRFQLEADLRFRRQVWEIAVPVPDGPIDADVMAEVADAFRDEYGRRYGRGSIVLGAPTELVSLRGIGIGATRKASLDATDLPAVAEGTRAQPVGSRLVRVGRSDDGAQQVAVYDAEDLHPGHVVAGPALLDGTDTTVWVPGTTALSVNRHGTLILEVTA
jgi:N-methylhydantoinase A